MFHCALRMQLSAWHLELLNGYSQNEWAVGDLRLDRSIGARLLEAFTCSVALNVPSISHISLQ